jgi:hypothetical protein
VNYGLCSNGADCSCFCLVAPGQFSDAAYDLVRLRKVLDDSNSHTPGRKGAALVGAELVQLQAACDACSQELMEVMDHWLRHSTLVTVSAIDV